jgi:fumarate hydratase class I
MANLQDAVVKLYKKAASSLPSDIEEAIVFSYQKEKSKAKHALSIILKNIQISKKTGRPLCQDTGVPVFFIKVPSGISALYLKKEIINATRIATKTIPLRANAVDIITEKNSGDNTGIGFPGFYFEETKGEKIIIDLMLKGAGSENIGQIYKLPMEDLKAERDLSGVRKCVLDAVYKAQGKGCPPYIVGVGIGAARDQVTRLSKEQLLRKIGDMNKHKTLSQFEETLHKDINMLGIGPLGLGGNTTALGVKVAVNHRHPASYFVDISISCWADRRARLIW